MIPLSHVFREVSERGHRQTQFRLKSLDKAVYDQMILLADALLAQTRIKPPNILLVTDDLNEISPIHRPTILATEGKYHGWAFGWHGSPDREIWIKPSTSTYFDKETLLHEISHVYVGPNRGHSVVWRSFYTRYRYHWYELFDKYNTGPTANGLPPLYNSTVYWTKRYRRSDVGLHDEVDKNICTMQRERASITALVGKDGIAKG